MFDYELRDGEHISIAGKYIDFPFSSEQIFPTDLVSSNWIGQSVEVDEKMEGAHAIVIHKWPADSEPLLLAEINGLTIARNE